MHTVIIADGAARVHQLPATSQAAGDIHIGCVHEIRWLPRGPYSVSGDLERHHQRYWGIDAEHFHAFDPLEPASDDGRWKVTDKGLFAAGRPWAGPEPIRRVECRHP